MMNDHDRDLIAALADGRLSGTAAEDALARVAADPEMAAAYAEHTTALSFLGGQDAPTMTAAESSALRASLVGHLGLLPSPEPATSRLKQTSRWRQSVFGIMTAAAVVTAIVILPGVLSQESADTAPTEAAAAFDEAETSTSTTAAASEAPAAAQLDDQATLESEESTTDFSGTATDELLGDSVGLADLVARARGATTDDEVASKLAPLMFSRDGNIESELISACLEQLEPILPPEIQSYLSLAVEVAADSTIAHIGIDLGSGLEAGITIDLSTCQIINETP